MQHSVSKAYPYSAGGDYYQALDDWLIDISLLFPLQKINKWYDFFSKKTEFEIFVEKINSEGHSNAKPCFRGIKYCINPK